MRDIDRFRENLQVLILKFEKDKNHYLSKGYPEAQVRVDFLNPFFKSLGWDIENKAHKPPHERDVIVELSPETTLRPDYNFRINGATKFFVEAKAPSVVLGNVDHILQAKSYAWSTKEVYFVILTDFEEFRLYDASLKPNPKFPDEGLIFDFKYTEYPDKLEKLWELSKERVEQGSLEALLPKDTKSKRLRIPPDKSFLEDLTIWRTELAKDIHKRNPEFDVNLLNDVVQRMLDRIIFIRIAEDRRIRPDRELWEIVAQWKEEGRRKSIMTHLKDLFHEINDDLNGDIFKPHACETADVDSVIMAELIESLYFPKSRYRFDAIGVELLGSIYERYLGSTIRVTPQRVKVEEKPEVRKAGGVYYTPKYIVDYIVKNTVGKVIEGKTPRQIEKIKILDPACGSGSFLLGAYQYLIDYHINYYRQHPKDRLTLEHPYFKRDILEEGLTIHEKARILKNNIFGVDIDPQATEITMMSLYLKALEGERGILPKKQHLLPSLGNNIKCGNSLIGYDILDGKLFDDDTKSRINPFDWNSKSVGFGEIMENGGFNVVIGNPPYVRQETIGEFKEYFQGHYEVYQGTADLYAYFIEKGVSLLRDKGLFSYIVANKWMRVNYGISLRRWLKKQRIEEIIDFGDLPVFEGATTYTCIIRIRNASAASYFEAIQVDTLNFNNLTDYAADIAYRVNKTALSDKGWFLANEQSQELFDKLRSIGVPLRDYVKGQIYRGVLTGLNKAFVIDTETKNLLAEEDPKSVELIKPFLVGRDIKRYAPSVSDKYLIFTRRGVNIKKYPAIERYLLAYKKQLTPKPKDWKGDEWPGRKPGTYKWYEIQDAVDYYSEFDKPKILWPGISSEVTAFAFDEKGFYGNDNTQLIIANDRYLLGILNSRLMRFILTHICDRVQGGFYRLKIIYIEQLPVRRIKLNNPSEKTFHDKLVSLVDKILELHKKKNSSPPSAEREKVEREIAVMDEKIDDIVYGLYGVTEEERKIIEGSL
ncbi:type IIS restriction enzyme Eco57I [bacterium BMS3Bbin09]|nr:type IIS restriction enzyme Eco57I [bacterium BMS3Bbin09]